MGRGLPLARCVPLLLVLVSLGLAVVPVAAASDTGELSGTVFNSHYESPVPQAYIVVTSDIGYTEARTTDEDGDYEFSLPYGVYDLRVILHDEELANATGVYIDPTPKVHDVFVSFQMDEVVALSGVITFVNERMANDRVVFEGIGNSYRNETQTDRDGRYSLDVPKGKLRVSVFEDGEEVGWTEVGPFTVPGDTTEDIEVRRTGEPPSLREWRDTFKTTWTGLIIWGASIIAMVFVYVFVVRRRVDGWADSDQTKVPKELAELGAYGTKGYFKVLVVYIVLVVMDAVVDIDAGPAVWYIRFWLWALVVVLFLWVTARLIMMLIDYLMERVRAQRRRAGTEIPETAFIFIHGLLRYITIAIFGFFILLIVLSGMGLYDHIAGGANRFVARNMGYLVLLVLIVVLFFITNRFVKLTLAQMRKTSTRFTPQMIGIMGLMARILVIFIFAVLFIFTLLTMAGMQEMGALIMALLTTMVGMIVAMTTTGAVGNALAGMVLMSLRPFEKDQWVEIGDDVFGRVIEVTVFFTRIRTFKNEIIEIPNNIVMANEMTNYSRGKMIGIEIELAIGYEVPAEVVLGLLKKGAKGTACVSKTPKPQALVTRFGDYAVHYLIRAFTPEVDRYFQIKSSLMQNLQEIFYTEGIEIMTPWQIMERTDVIPQKEEIIKRYVEHLKHKERLEDEDGTIATGLDILDDGAVTKDED